MNKHEKRKRKPLFEVLVNIIHILFRTQMHVHIVFVHTCTDLRAYSYLHTSTPGGVRQKRGQKAAMARHPDAWWRPASRDRQVQWACTRLYAYVVTCISRLHDIIICLLMLPPKWLNTVAELGWCSRQSCLDDAPAKVAWMMLPPKLFGWCSRQSGCCGAWMMHGDTHTLYIHACKHKTCTPNAAGNSRLSAWTRTLGTLCYKPSEVRTRTL